MPTRNELCSTKSIKIETLLTTLENKSFQQDISKVAAVCGSRFPAAWKS
jgi:hypothetical protein